MPYVPENKTPEEKRAIMSARGRAGGLAGGGKRSARKMKEIAVKAAMKQRIFAMADKLLNAQAIAALGTHRMVVLSFDEEGKKHIETVRDEKRMDTLLDTGVYGQDYLILAGAEPDWKAAESLLTRALGKPKETLDVNHNVFSLTQLAKSRKDLEALPEPTPVSFRELPAPPEGV